VQSGQLDQSNELTLGAVKAQRPAPAGGHQLQPGQGLDRRQVGLHQPRHVQVDTRPAVPAPTGAGAGPAGDAASTVVLRIGHRSLPSNRRVPTEHNSPERKNSSVGPRAATGSDIDDEFLKLVDRLPHRRH
jgi:hypothetical protein